MGQSSHVRPSSHGVPFARKVFLLRACRLLTRLIAVQTPRSIWFIMAFSMMAILACAKQMSEVTQILFAIEQGDPHAAERLLPLIYDELRKLAAQKMASERPGQTLQATALVHEAYIRLVDTEQVQHWNSRGHLFAAAAEAMRRILVEQARHKRHREGRRRVSANQPIGH